MLVATTRDDLLLLFCSLTSFFGREKCEFCNSEAEFVNLHNTSGVFVIELKKI
jgi:hypothetical protein